MGLDLSHHARRPSGGAGDHGRLHPGDDEGGGHGQQHHAAAGPEKRLSSKLSRQQRERSNKLHTRKIKALFQLIDADGSGQISSEDLGTASRTA